MEKDGFYVQLHIHTSETSACGKSGGAEIARACKEAGYDMIVITDHFFNANIGCNNFKNKPDFPQMELTWPEKVEYLLRGYRAAKEEGDKIGLKVLFGWETFTAGPEYLTYGLDDRFLLENPDIAEISKEEYSARTHAAGAYLIHAHPFRKAYYIPEFTPVPALVDAFEVYNAGHRDPSFNDQALAMARKFDMVMTAGSDAHHVDSVRGGAMKFPRALETMDDLIAALRNREGEIVERL